MWLYRWFRGSKPNLAKDLFSLTMSPLRRKFWATDAATEKPLLLSRSLENTDAASEGIPVSSCILSDSFILASILFDARNSGRIS